MDELIAWFRRAQRDLRWRGTDRDPWAVLVSETMLQQTQVSRVIPAFDAWMARWPTPADLAGAPVADVLRAWDRLGYPRRALRLQQAAAAIATRHGNRVPADYDALVALPGVGDYTASAVLAFAFRRRQPVLDTNVRRVIVRLHQGHAVPPASAATAAERRATEEMLPQEAELAAELSEAWMELGALICTARNPRCTDCPLATRCAWLLAGRPEPEEPRRLRQPRFGGSDRQVRGLIMAAARAGDGPIARTRVDRLWPQDPAQLERARRSLLSDGLIVLTDDGAVTLP